MFDSSGVSVKNFWYMANLSWYGNICKIVSWGHDLLNQIEYNKTFWHIRSLFGVTMQFYLSYHKTSWKLPYKLGQKRLYLNNVTFRNKQQVTTNKYPVCNSNVLDL